MLTRLKYPKILKIAVCLFIVTTAVFLLSNFVLAATGPDVGLSYAAGTGLSNATDIRVIIARIIRIILGFLGIIALGLIIYAGFLWMTSGGEEQKIEEAKKILKNAIIGLIIILSAFAIVSFLLNMLNGGTWLNNKKSGGQPKSIGLSALGNGIIESHYPFRDQKEVPRNTSIIITFREPISPDSLCIGPTTGRCIGEDMNTAVARIYMKSQEANCASTYSLTSGCSSLADARVYSSVDNKNFVFVPKVYLGSPSEYINYSVYLSNDLYKLDGNKAFSGLGDYGWSFEVSNKIDLTPPQVREERLVPAPDNIKDTILPVSVSQNASGTIKVNSQPLIDKDASVVSVIAGGGSPAASAEISNDCQLDGNYNINIQAGPLAILYKNSINMGQGIFGSSGGFKRVVFSECNLTLTMALMTDDFADGNIWTLDINKSTTADTITVGNITYAASNIAGTFTFPVVGLTNADIAQRIYNVLVGNSDVTPTVSGDTVTVTANIAGVSGNNIVLSSSNPTAFTIVPMGGGANQEDQVNVQGKRDQPMNVAIEIVFNEAIIPLTIAGTSDDVKDFIKVVNADTAAQNAGGACSTDADCRSFICNAGTCDSSIDYYLKGKFVISNLYRTVDFLSDKECGFNACGEKIYCLPANSHLRVEMNTANLIPCTNDTECQAYAPFNSCDMVRQFCWDSDHKYYPQADKTKPNIVDGVVDAALNSLDGNRDDSAYGQDSYFNENDLWGSCASGINMGKACTLDNQVNVCGVSVTCTGSPLPLTLVQAQLNQDSYLWSFFISDKLDLTPPQIIDTTPLTNGTASDLITEVKITFDKLMLSSRLSTGSLIIQNGNEKIQHYLLNLRSFIDQPLGYWVTNEGIQSVLNGEIDQTEAYINHSAFSKASTYKAQAGSGLKDIYQNCYLPCAGPACPGVTSSSPCCCNGSLGTSCN